MIRMVINIRSIGMACMLLFCCFVVRGQAGAPKVCLDSVRVRLERAARLDSTYFSEIDLSIGHLSIGELLRNIARVHGVNLCVKVDEGRMVTCNFNRARLIDLLYFLCREYNLELDVVGNIISLSEPVPLVVAPREPKIETDSTKKRLYYDLLDDGLVAVMKRVTALTGEHVVIPKSLYGNRVSGYSAGLPVLEAIRTLASVNGLEIERDKNGVWRFEAPLPPAGGNLALASSYVKRRNFTPDQVNVDSAGRVSVSLNRGNIHDVVLEIFVEVSSEVLTLGDGDVKRSLAAPETGEKTSAWDCVQKARKKDRPVGEDYIRELFPDFIEFHGDRLYGDDAAIIGGIASFDGTPVTVIAEAKGADTKENIRRNFGMPSPEGYRKALRLMKQAEKFHRPVICLVDTPGAFCGMEAEERGQGEAIARNLYEMSALKTPVLSIVISEGGSGGALALAVADEVWMMQNAIYSILSPEGFASILWKDGKRAPEAAEVMKLTAGDLKKLGIVEEIVEEPGEFTVDTMPVVCEELRGKILRFLEKYEKMDGEELVEERYRRFRDM